MLFNAHVMANVHFIARVPTHTHSQLYFFLDLSPRATTNKYDFGGYPAKEIYLPVFASPAPILKLKVIIRVWSYNTTAKYLLSVYLLPKCIISCFFKLLPL